MLGHGSPSTASELVFGVGKGIASTVYGTVTVMATITAAAAETHPWTIAELALTTALVLWVAHLYAHALSESIVERQPLTVHRAAAIGRREVGILFAALLPSTALLLGGLGVLRENRAIWLALGIGLATLFVQGVRYGHVTGLGTGGRVAAVTLNVALGLLVVALKVSLGH